MKESFSECDWLNKWNQFTEESKLKPAIQRASTFLRGTAWDMTNRLTIKTNDLTANSCIFYQYDNERVMAVLL